MGCDPCYGSLLLPVSGEALRMRRREGGKDRIMGPSTATAAVCGKEDSLPCNLRAFERPCRRVAGEEAQSDSVSRRGCWKTEGTRLWAMCPGATSSLPVSVSPVWVGRTVERSPPPVLG